MTKNAYVLCAAINCLPLFELTTISTVLPSTSKYVLEHIKNLIFLIAQAFGYCTDYGRKMAKPLILCDRVAHKWGINLCL